MAEGQVLRVQRVHPDAVVPARSHPGDAGVDLVSIEHTVLLPGERAVVSTGIAVEIPSGWCGLVCPRSGLAARHGIGVVNGPGVIDAGYRGEVRVVLINHDTSEALTVNPGDRIAQLVLVPVMLAEVVEVTSLAQAERNDAGFGSTGGVRAMQGGDIH
jgi:dUTP pyrophosphatase